MFRNLFLLLFACNCWVSMDAQAIIRGKADGYADEYVILYRMTDVISGRKVIVDKQLVNRKTEFEFAIQNIETTPYYLSIGAQLALIYVEPNKKYDVVFPPVQPGTIRKFDGTEVSLQFENTDENELNVLIRNFNQLYFKFINEHYYDFATGAYAGNADVKSKIMEKAGRSGETKDAMPVDSLERSPSNFPLIVESFKASIDSLFAQYFANVYFKDYVDFSISEIELLAGLHRKFYYESYFMSRALPYLNPAFGSAFRLFYKNTFANAEKSMQAKWIKAVNLEHNGQQMIMALESDTITRSQEIRGLVCLQILKDAKPGSALLEPAVLQTLEDFAQNAANSSIAQIAKEILVGKQQFKVGWKVEDFTLLDLKGQKWIWSQEQKKSTYFLFFATWSAASLKELAMLQKLHVEYGEDFDFVAVGMDNDVELLKKYIAEHRDLKVLFLNGAADPLLKVKTNMKSVPHALWLDDQGSMLVEYARKPSEGLQMDLQKHLAMLKKTGKTGAKTWKDQ